MTLLPCTYLFVPADRPERFAKALNSGADRVIIDLEDAVKPENKPAARRALQAANMDWARVVVRVNDAASPFRAEDLTTVAATAVSTVMVPKAELPETLAAVRTATGRDIEIIPQIETAVGLARLEALLQVPGVRRCAFGHLDFALDLGCAPDWESLLMARCELVFRSRLADRQPPIDSVTPDITDEAALSREAAAARRLGFGGKLLIHPKQVALVQRAFAPSLEEVAWAERVLAAAGSAGTVQIDGCMVDKPVVDAARLILARSRVGEEG